MRLGVRQLHRHSFTNICRSIKKGGERVAKIGQEYTILLRSLISQKICKKKK